MSKQVYLAGSIAGETFGDANSWRELVTLWLTGYSPNVEVRNPLRGKEHFQGSSDEFTKFEYTSNVITAQKEIARRDFHDVTTSDCLFVNLLGSPNASIGTLMEIAWAYHARIPVVLVMERKGNVNDHLFVRECATYQTESMQEASDYVCLHILGEIK